jgi:hypothetical protein
MKQMTTPQRAIGKITVRRGLNFSVMAVLALAAPGLFAQTHEPQVFALHDANGLIAPKVKTEAVDYLGRKSVRITMEGKDHDGLALLPDTDFQDGVKHDAAGSPATGIHRNCFPCMPGCIAIRGFLLEAGKFPGAGSGEAQPCSPIRIGAGFRMVSAASGMAVGV